MPAAASRRDACAVRDGAVARAVADRRAGHDWECPASASRSTMTASASGGLPSFSAQPTRSPTTTPARPAQRAGELAAASAGDRCGRDARRPLRASRTAPSRVERQRRAAQPRERSRGCRRRSRPSPRPPPATSVRSPVSGGGGAGDSSSANSAAASSAGSSPSCVTTGPCTRPTPARAAQACSAVTSEKPTMGLGARANAAASSRSRMRMSP